MENRKKYNESPYIKRYFRIAWIIPLCILMASIILSVYESSWAHFSRAGSLIIVVGIYIAFEDLSGAIYSRANNDHFKMSEILENACVFQMENNELTELIKSAKEVERINRENRRFSAYVSQKFRTMEAILLVSGTIIWGYGDLVLMLLCPLHA